MSTYPLASFCSVTEEMGKPGSDAGMPGIEDSEVGKIDDVQFGKQWSETLKVNLIVRLAKLNEENYVDGINIYSDNFLWQYRQSKVK